MLILIGPSASGKTEVANILINKYNMKRMVTYTTRKIREGEVPFVSYNFVSQEEFLNMMNNDEFVETVEYNGNYYGTRKKDVEDGKIVILEPNGFKAFYKKMKDKITSFYLNTKEVVRIDRMIYRKDKEEDILKRIENDRIAFSNITNIDYYIENENISLIDLADKIYQLYENKINNKEKV